MRVFNSATIDSPANRSEKASASGYRGSVFDTPETPTEQEVLGMGVRTGGNEGEVSAQEQRVLDRVAEDLARLGRVKRVGLGVGEKIEFLRVWLRRRR